MRVDGNSGRATSYEPNRQGEWQQQPDFAEPPLAIDGDAAKFNFREDDDDYYSQPGILFRMLKPDEQQRLFENTGRAIREASKEVQDRHIANRSKGLIRHTETVSPMPLQRYSNKVTNFRQPQTARSRVERRQS